MQGLKIIKIQIKYELRRKREEILKLSTNFPSVCLIGVTGHGKSTTANMLVGEKEYFKTSSMIKSQTTSCSGVVRNWFGDPNQSQLLVLDTPGLGDSESRDSNHIANMVQSLKSVGYVNTFLLVINSQEPRFNEMLKESFKIFESMFGGDFYKNIQFCFTRFFYNQSLIRIRERGFQMTESEIIQQFRERFYAHFNYYLTLKQFIFIDNMLFIDPDDDYSLLEQLKFKEAKNRIKTFTMNNDIFLCQDIKQVQKENDRIKQDIEELMIKNEREIKTLQEEFDLKLGMQKKKNLDQQIKMQEKFKIDQQKLKQEQKEQAEKALQENKKLKEENSGLREMKCGLQLLPPKPTPSLLNYISIYIKLDLVSLLILLLQMYLIIIKEYSFFEILRLWIRFYGYALIFLFVKLNYQFLISNFYFSQELQNINVLLFFLYKKQSAKFFLSFKILILKLSNIFQIIVYIFIIQIINYFMQQNFIKQNISLFINHILNSFNKY